VLASLAFALPAPAFEPFGRAVVTPDFEANGAGIDMDTIAFWESADPESSMMFVTAKGNSLVEVWRHPYAGRELPPLRHPTFADSRVNGVVVDQERDLLYVSISSPSSTVAVFTLPDLGFVRDFHKPGVDLRSEPNLALLEEPTGERRIYVTADDVVYVHDAATGEYLSEFVPGPPLETIAADRHYQALYIPDEKKRSGVWAVRADGRPYPGAAASRFGGDGVFQKDGEGILVYECGAHGTDTGCGLIVVADQRPEASDFEFFDRASWEHLGTLVVEGVSGTDGIASTQAESPVYPKGLFAAVDHDTSTVGVSWEKIFAATGLRCPQAPESADRSRRTGNEVAARPRRGA
jgi:hypothetical protein